MFVLSLMHRAPFKFSHAHLVAYRQLEQVIAAERECQRWQVALLRERALDAKQRLEHKVMTHALFEAPKSAMRRMGRQATPSGNAPKRRAIRKRQRNVSTRSLATPASSIKSSGGLVWAASSSSTSAAAVLSALKPSSRSRSRTRASREPVELLPSVAPDFHALGHDSDALGSADVGELFGLRVEKASIERELGDLLELVDMIR